MSVRQRLILFIQGFQSLSISQQLTDSEFKKAADKIGSKKCTTKFKLS